ncbi:MAG: 2Fe-2S iron-sulfur cluster-binding protein [Sphingomonas adhaesiva]|uniref:2Fe-2S iron-sulfur cluster-binding protein n=1 Tax=Sphingomonas adhaesiva TaxID=28212 RepID=UPI002FF55A8C
MRIRFVTAEEERDAEAVPGERLLDVAQRAGMPLEGTCGGELACATCHVVVAADDAARLPPASEEEEDMLDLVPDARRTSRLSCQIRLTERMDKLTVSLP